MQKINPRKYLDNSVASMIEGYIRRYNKTYGLLAFETGRAIWFKKLPFFVRILFLLHNFDENFFYIYHVHGMTWSTLVVRFLRYGMNIASIVESLQLAIYYQVRVKEQYNRPATEFEEHDIIDNSIIYLEETFVEWSIYYDRGNFFEETKKLYFAFAAHRQDSVTVRLLGVDSFMRNWLFCCYVYQQYFQTFHKQSPHKRMAVKFFTNLGFPP